ncbi:MAG: hypothetical protein ACRCXT_23750 [Paraclostridium sp.]
MTAFFAEGIDPGGVRKDNDPTAYLLFYIIKFPQEELPFILPIDGFKESALDINQIAEKIHTLRRKYG